MIVLQTKLFSKIVKKLHTNQKIDLDIAIKTIVATPKLGDAKIGDLSGVFVYKFKMQKQQTLLAYTYNKQILTLTLLALGTHEIFIVI